MNIRISDRLNLTYVLIVLSPVVPPFAALLIIPNLILILFFKHVETYDLKNHDYHEKTRVPT